MRPPDQTANAVRADRKHLERILERAQQNKTRPRERNDKITQLLSQLVVLYTEETITPLTSATSAVMPTRPAAAPKRRTG